MIRYRTNQKAEIDLHGMTRDEARRCIVQFLNRVDGSVREVEIIHGWSNGTALMDMVRKGLKHPKIKSKVMAMNPGITILILK